MPHGILPLPHPGGKGNLARIRPRSDLGTSREGLVGGAFWAGVGRFADGMTLIRPDDFFSVKTAGDARRVLSYSTSPPRFPAGLGAGPPSSELEKSRRRGQPKRVVAREAPDPAPTLSGRVAPFSARAPARPRPRAPGSSDICRTRRRSARSGRVCSSAAVCRGTRWGR